MKQAGIYVNDVFCGILPELEDLTMKMAEAAHSGFDRNTFMTAFTQSGIPAAVANKMIDRMKGYFPEWKELIGQSFLPDGMKADYCRLLQNRLALL